MTDLSFLGPRASSPLLHRGWHSRGYLPHFDRPDLTQSVTFRLNDSLPLHVAEQLAANEATEGERRQQTERELDRGLGACCLRDPSIAALVQDALLHFDGERYRLLAWVIMPNHVHAVVEVMTDHPLDRIVHSWKSFTATAINRKLGKQGRLWQPDYWDRFIRDEEHFRMAVSYVERNPVEAGLSATIGDFRWGSGWAGWKPAAPGKNPA